jgi:hypothetical protein
MIKGITSGAGISITNGSAQNMFSPAGESDRVPVVGDVRYHSGNFQVYDYGNWQIVPAPYATISLDHFALTAINWVTEKMRKEQELTELAKTYPVIDYAQQHLRTAQEQLDVAVALVKSRNTDTQ